MYILNQLHEDINNKMDFTKKLSLSIAKCKMMQNKTKQADNVPRHLDLSKMFCSFDH